MLSGGQDRKFDVLETKDLARDKKTRAGSLMRYDTHHPIEITQLSRDRDD